MSREKIPKSAGDAEKLPLGARIALIRKRADLTQDELAQKLDMPTRTLSSYERGESDPRWDWVVDLAGVLNVDLHWIMTGEYIHRVAEGDLPYQTPGSETELLDTLRTYFNQVVQVRPHTVWRDVGEGEIDPDDYRAVPVLADPAAAGSGRLMSDEVDEYALIHHRVVPHPENVRCLRIAGDSMAPILPDHSIVAVDVTQKDVERAIGRIVCARTESDEIVIKRLWWGEDKKYLALEPEASGFEYERIAVDLAVQPDPLIGVVVWAWIDLRGKEGGP